MFQLGFKCLTYLSYGMFHLISMLVNLPDVNDKLYIFSYFVAEPFEELFQKMDITVEKRSEGVNCKL